MKHAIISPCYNYLQFFVVQKIILQHLSQQNFISLDYAMLLAANEKPNQLFSPTPAPLT